MKKERHSLLTQRCSKVAYSQQACYMLPDYAVRRRHQSWLRRLCWRQARLCLTRSSHQDWQAWSLSSSWRLCDHSRCQLCLREWWFDGQGRGRPVCSASGRAELTCQEMTTRSNWQFGQVSPSSQAWPWCGPLRCSCFLGAPFRDQLQHVFAHRTTLGPLWSQQSISPAQLWSFWLPCNHYWFSPIFV